MCGISGILATEPKDLSVIRGLTNSLSHRGPDDEGYAARDRLGNTRHFVSADLPECPTGTLALGHRRLSILDTSSAGHQPMEHPDGDLIIIYNGEVYNYLELRIELEKLGCRFRTGTDTEVVLEAYKQWGTQCFARFNGMWSLAIWDERRKSLILSRDRFGIKPLHYLIDKNVLYFASEIKALLCVDVYRPKLNNSIAADFLRWGLVNHNNETFFAGINAFPPACFCIISQDNVSRISPQPYWTPNSGTLSSSRLSAIQAEEEFLSLFGSAVALRQRSDVPVGACLSGGLDSSAIVCEATRANANSSPFATFTSASKLSDFDERRWSDIVNQACNTKAHTVFPSASAFRQDLDHLILAQEEPFPSASIYAQYLLMRKAREEEIPVLLDGQGADEALCGYRKYVAYSFLESLQEGHWLDLFTDIFGWATTGDKGLLQLSQGVRYLPRFLQRGNAEPLYEHVLPGFNDVWSQSLPGTGLQTYRASERQIDDLVKHSVPALLRYEDRNSMAWGIESRVPFLDYRLVEFLLGLPTRLKVNKGRTKSLMRNALKGRIPDEVLQRRDKMGFVTPMHVWMRGELRRDFEHALTSSDFRLRSLIDQQNVTSLLDMRGYWSWASLNAAFRVFILDRWAKLHDVEITV